MPLLYKQQNGACVGIWEMTETVDELKNMLGSKALSSPSVSMEIRSEARQKERLTALVLLKELLGHEAIISHEESGAPFLPEENMNISISHTKGYAAIILYKEKEIGIDIEYRSDRVKKIKSRFVNEAEALHISPENETEHLLIHWCAKETLFKMIGCNEVDFLKHLHISPFIYNKEGIINVSESRTENQKSYKLYFRVSDNFVITYTSCE